MPNLKQTLEDMVRRNNQRFDAVERHTELLQPHTLPLAYFQQIPGLLAYYPMSSRNESGNVIDLSGQGRTLTNNSSTAFGLDGSQPYAIGDGSADYLSRADEAGLSVTGTFSVGGWFYSDDTPAGNETPIGKWNTTGNQRSYIIRMTSAPAYTGLISSNGTATTTVTSTVTYAAAAWKLMVLIYTPSTSLDLCINQNGVIVKTSNTTSIPASVFDSTAAFAMMANGAGAEFLDGRAAHGFLSNVALTQSYIDYLFNATRHAFGL